MSTAQLIFEPSIKQSNTPTKSDNMFSSYMKDNHKTVASKIPEGGKISVMADTNNADTIVKPWIVIVANLPVHIYNNIHVDNYNINLKQRWKRQGYLINNFQPSYDYRGHSGFTLVEFSRDMEGLKSIFLFDLAFAEKDRGKAEWEAASE
ncbi:Uncharacterized protein Fot_11697 [Forsythia ovata]|uniref:XS domain-containing protein n=1 Tax=Forsythia ovata TaxID=205694 RepID=A0ABD1WKE4_9LAMI